ncbi:hypothetical protein HY625_00305 [Candidatus Uhrbacteria bacterium]|nr:hypothetical protein [Candidatus Uhrbacteria bacterium]
MDVNGMVKASIILSGPSTNLVQLGSHFGSGEKGVWMSYGNTPGKATIQAEEQGIAWKDLLLNPSGGNVGIGTASPQAKLDVQGDIRIGTNIIEATTGWPKGNYCIIQSIKYGSFSRSCPDGFTETGIITDSLESGGKSSINAGITYTKPSIGEYAAGAQNIGSNLFQLKFCCK